jgi:hypothetical protein
MFKLRIHLSAIFILCSLVCAIWALPNNNPSPEQKARCDHNYTNCTQRCNRVYSRGDRLGACMQRCMDGYNNCTASIGISTPPKTANLPPNVPTAVQASPTAPPSRTTHLPQGTLTQASATPTPNTREKKKKN